MWPVRGLYGRPVWSVRPMRPVRGLYRVAQKRPKLCVTIMVHILYRAEFLFLQICKAVCPVTFFMRHPGIDLAYVISFQSFVFYIERLHFYYRKWNIKLLT